MTYHDILHTVLVNLKAIIKITIISVIIVFFYLLFISPITYISPVTILPPAEKDQMSGLTSLLSGGDISSLLLGGSFQGNSQLYIEILKSRTAAEYVVKKHNMVEFYSAEDLNDACKKLQNKLDLNLSKEGIVTLSVDVSTGLVPKLFSAVDSIKDLSAKLSNSYVEALDKINREKLSSKAKKAREYIERQLQITKVSLDSAEVHLMNFQKRNKTISLPEQLQSAIKGAAELKSEIVQTEIEIGLLAPNLKEDNRSLIQLRKKLAELQKEYEKFEIGSNDYLLAFKDVPELGMELAKLVREVKIQNEVYLLLQQQYYKEKIQENKDLPTVDILDEAIIPSKASSPRLIYSTFLSTIFIFLAISLFFVIKEKRLIEAKRKINI